MSYHIEMKFMLGGEQYLDVHSEQCGMGYDAVLSAIKTLTSLLLISGQEKTFDDDAIDPIIKNLSELKIGKK